MISKPVSSIAGYSPETPGAKHSSKRLFPSGLAWSRGDGSAWASTDLADHLRLGWLPCKGWSLSLESRKPSRKMERAWEESVSALSRAQQHQDGKCWWAAISVVNSLCFAFQAPVAAVLF